MQLTSDIPPRLLLVDDDPINLQALRNILQDDYRLMFATCGKDAVSLAQEHSPDMILLDVLMSDMDGYEVCSALKKNKSTYRIPVIFITVLSDTGNEEHGFSVGAVDYIHKPINAQIVKARVRTHLSLVRVDALNEAHLQIVRRLSKASELNDEETGRHIIRVSRYAELLALKVGKSAAWAQDLFNAVPMHDIGKIGIPKHILRKPAKLNKEEWAIIRQHPEMGAAIIGEHDSRMLKMAYIIALQHHERWDGKGYPYGIMGDRISLEARITALADVFDALTSKRAYKEAWSVENAACYIREQAGGHFDPDLVKEFLTLMPKVDEVRCYWKGVNGLS